MTSWQEILAAAIVILLVLILLVRSSLRKCWDRRYRAALRKLETVLQPRETVKAICPQKKGRWILTSKRLLFETREGFTAISLKNIKRVQGNTSDKKTTTSVPKMVSLTVKSEADHVIYNTSEEFAGLVKQLQDKIKKQNQKK